MPAEGLILDGQTFDLVEGDLRRVYETSSACQRIALYSAHKNFHFLCTRLYKQSLSNRSVEVAHPSQLPFVYLSTTGAASRIVLKRASPPNYPTISYRTYRGNAVV